jgi:hypothetical protein
MTDYLAQMNERDVAAFYRRLAAFIQAQIGGDSLAATLLLHWLDGKGRDKIFPARYVRNLIEVRSYLRSKARLIFLSTIPTPSGAPGGVIPRIKGTIKADPPGGPYAMHLEGNVETPVSIEARLFFGLSVDPQEVDAFYGLHGFSLISDVVASATKTAASQYLVKFDRWTCKTSDEYHWNPEKHIDVPNPDYGSKLPNAVAPGERKITIYHRNAIRVEKAGLAAPFHDESEPWDETDPAVVGPSTVRV